MSGYGNWSQPLSVRYDVWCYGVYTAILKQPLLHQFYSLLIMDLQHNLCSDYVYSYTMAYI